MFGVHRVVINFLLILLGFLSISFAGVARASSRALYQVGYVYGVAGQLLHFIQPFFYNFGISIYKPVYNLQIISNHFCGFYMPMKTIVGVNPIAADPVVAAVALNLFFYQANSHQCIYVSLACKQSDAVVFKSGFELGNTLPSTFLGCD